SNTPFPHGLFLITLVNDSIPEGAEDILMVLSNPRGSLLGVDGSYGYLGAQIPPYVNRPALGFRDTAIFRIQDDDFTPGNLGFSANSPTSATEGDGSITITVVRSGGTVGTVSTLFTITPMTAVVDVDYTAVTTTLTFGPGENSKTVTIPVLDDIV